MNLPVKKPPGVGGKHQSEITELVGAARFELAASRSQSERTTRLCYAPCVSLKKRFQVSNSKRECAQGQVKVRQNAVKMGLFVKKRVLDG